MILSRQDLSDEDNVKSCVHQLREILDHVIDQRDDMSIAAYTSEWMKNWGEAIIERLQSFGDLHAETEAANDEATQAEDKFSELKGVVEGAIEDLDDAIEAPASKVSAIIEKVSTNLDKAITK